MPQCGIKTGLFRFALEYPLFPGSIFYLDPGKNENVCPRLSDAVTDGVHRHITDKNQKGLQHEKEKSVCDTRHYNQSDYVSFNDDLRVFESLNPRI
jgi:hypothetical protein